MNSLLDPSYSQFLLILALQVGTLLFSLVYVGWELMGGEEYADKAWSKAKYALLAVNILVLVLYTIPAYKIITSDNHSENFLLVCYMFAIFTTVFYGIGWTISRFKDNKKDKTLEEEHDDDLDEFINDDSENTL